jgi:7tm Odorant receptor
MKSSKFIEALKVPLSILKIAGLWENENLKTKQKARQFCVHLFFVEVFILLQIVYLFTSKDLVDNTRLISIVLSNVALSIKTLYLLKERKAIVALIEEARELAALIETEDEESLNILIKRANHAKKAFMTNLVIGLVTVFNVTMVAILTNTIGSHSTYEPLFKIWLPFDYANNIYCFSFVLIYEVITATMTIVTLVSLDTLPIFFLNVGAGLLEELGVRLSRVCDEGKEDKMAMKEFEKCIEIHIKIKRFVENIEKRFSPVIFVQGSISIIVLCTLIFQLTKVSF